MRKAPKVYEKQIQHIWKNQLFQKSLQTNLGDEIEVLDAGVENTENGGPDFRNARIRIGNFTYVGDIEIDNDYSDWKQHGHNIDRKYNKVILHASFTSKFNQGYVYNKDGRKIPSVCLDGFLASELVTELKSKFRTPHSNLNKELKCYGLNEDVGFGKKEDFIKQLGIDRFKKKCDKNFHRLKELAFLKAHKIKEPVVNYELSPEFQNKDFSNEDFKEKELWQQLLYELIFEALGYSQNKNVMHNLAQSVNVDFLKKLGHDTELVNRFESVLFNISGLVPSEEKIHPEAKGYVNSLDSEWEIIKRIYDGKTFDETQWHFFKLRPQNFPTIRLAGGARLLNTILYEDLIGTLIKKTKEIRNLKVLINSVRSLFVIKSDGFWSNHYVFNEPANGEIKYFVGASRADEIVINVVLPFLAVYFNIFDDELMSKKILKIFSIYNQRSDNKIVRDVATGLDMNGLLKRTVYNQGMIELFRNYCSKNKCLDCEIGKVVFN